MLPVVRLQQCFCSHPSAHIFWCEPSDHHQVLEVSDAAVFTGSVVVFAVSHLHMQKIRQVPF